MKRLLVACVFMLVAETGCSVPRGVEGLDKGRAILTADEISETSAHTAYEAVQICRPAFFVARGFKTLAGTRRPVVYLDGLYFGEVESLNYVLASEVRDIRFMDGKDAAIRYGTNHVSGVIVVTTGVE